MIRTHLKEVLRSKKIKQKDLAERVEVSPTTMSSLCKGKSIPTLIVALRIAKELNTSIHEIWELE